jgi:hypothetical protein
MEYYKKLNNFTFIQELNAQEERVLFSHLIAICSKK